MIKIISRHICVSMGIPMPTTRPRQSPRRTIRRETHRVPFLFFLALPQKPDSVSSEKTSSLVFKARDLAPRAPRSVSVADQVCPNSAPQSAATTPSVSPQQSPTLIRKILSADSHCKAGELLSPSICLREGWPGGYLSVGYGNRSQSISIKPPQILAFKL